jgi:hypothetical protein
MLRPDGILGLYWLLRSNSVSKECRSFNKHTKRLVLLTNRQDKVVLAAGTGTTMQQCCPMAADGNMQPCLQPSHTAAFSCLNGHRQHHYVIGVTRCPLDADDGCPHVLLHGNGQACRTAAAPIAVEQLRTYPTLPALLLEGSPRSVTPLALLPQSSPP